MKIVFIGPFGLRPKATMSVRALPLAKALAARGHTVTVLIPPWDDPDRAGQQWQEDGVQVINVPLPPRWPLLFHLLLTRLVVIQTLALQPEVVHFFKPKAYAGLAHLALWSWRWMRRLSLRLVVDADDWEQAWNERLPYSLSQKKFFTWQEQWGLRHADAVTVASRALLELITAEIGVDPARLFYLPNGCCPLATTGNRQPATNGHASPGGTRLEPIKARLGQVGEAPTILLYSRFVEFRLERIIRLVKLVAAQLPPARWLIVGQGLQGEEKRLKSELQQADLAEYVHFAGWHPADQLAYFSAADVAVFPYDNTLINRTKCSVKLVDLLTAAVPVVADAVGQNKEYIQHEVSGLLVPAENDAALVEAVVALLQSPDQRNRLGQAAAESMRRNFAWSTLAQVSEKAYRC